LIDFAAWYGDVGECGSKGDFEEGFDVVAVEEHLVACENLRDVLVKKP
jgi:hypothetical protein